MEPTQSGWTLAGMEEDLLVTDDDVAVWQSLAGADAEALSRLYDRYATAIYNFAFRRSASWSVAEDVVSDTFTVVWRRAKRSDLPSLERPTALPYLLAVASHECVNRMRTDHRWSAAVHRGGLTLAEPDPAETVASRVDEEARMKRVRAALKKLPRRQRDVVELVAWAGLSTADAAQVLGIAAGTAKSRLSRARKSLNDMVDKPERNSGS